MQKDDSQVLQDALQYINDAYGFMLEKGYEVFSAEAIPMGWQVVLRKHDLFVSITEMRNEDAVSFRTNTQPSDEFIDLGIVVYASTGEKIPNFLGSYAKVLKTYLDKIETYFEGEYVKNKDSLRTAQKEYREAVFAKETEIIPILHHPLMGVVIILVVGLLTALYMGLLMGLFSALSIDFGAYSMIIGLVALLGAIGTLLVFRRRSK